MIQNAVFGLDAVYLVLLDSLAVMTEVLLFSATTLVRYARRLMFVESGSVSGGHVDIVFISGTRTIFVQVQLEVFGRIGCGGTRV